jgi:hypothetical protein
VVAKDAWGTGFDVVAAFAKCRHTYFNTWMAFQIHSEGFFGSTCVGHEFTDNGDGSVTDELSGLVWEEKTNLDGVPNLADPHDADNMYALSTGSNPGNGTVFTNFLATLNADGGFAGSNDWRLPTLAELQTIVMDFVCRPRSCICSSSPCVNPYIGVANTQSNGYWSATSYISAPARAWLVGFGDADMNDFSDTSFFYVRAVRGGM